ncbi:MAG TPA: branched-chain amino acid ABC transporter permease [Burkholderiaceae bacterium]|jgi:branched-chain amino acid transport system permease protein|nr:branched-chain amino acid ABC transporter permease [Burkholderiaceae bacterium]
MGADLATLVVAGLSTGAIYGLIALGFNVIFKATDAINFAQGEWVMMGGMVAAALYAGGRMPLLAACLGAVALVAVVGLLSDLLVMRRLRAPTPLLITLVSVGLAIATKSLVMLTLGKNPAGLPAFSGEAPLRVGTLSVQPQTLWIVAVTAVVMVGAHLFFARTTIGKAMRASAAQPEAASLVGIDPRASMLLSFGIAAAVGAIAGVIVTPITLTSFDHGTMLGFKGFCAAMFGGLGSLPGAVAGGLVLGVLESVASGAISSAFKDAVAFVVLLGVLFVRPSGLFGRGAIERI